MSDRFAAGIPIDLVDSTGGHKVAEPTDPYAATAVAFPTPGYDGHDAMARSFVVEFALLGWSRERIARMFRVPRFVAAHHVYRTRGPAYVAALLDDVLGPARPEED